MPVHRYIKLPVHVEAIEYDGKNSAEIAQFTGRPASSAYGNKIIVHTLHGPAMARPSDFIVKTVCGDFYPCDAEVFRRTHQQTT